MDENVDVEMAADSCEFLKTCLSAPVIPAAIPAIPLADKVNEAWILLVVDRDSVCMSMTVMWIGL